MGRKVTQAPVTLASVIHVRPTRGFSLIELLVVVAVIAVLTVGATMLAGRSSSRGGSDAQLFRTQFETQRDLAITGGQTRGLRLNTTNMRPALRTTDGWDLAGTPIRLGARAVLSVARGARNNVGEAPQIIFLASGRNTPFTLTLGTVRCETDGWSGLTCNE